MLGAAQPEAQAATREEAVSFVQNAIATKAGGDCGALNTSTVSPVYTPYGPVGGGASTFYSQKLYIFWDPMVSPTGELHLTFIDVSHSMAPGFVGPSESTFATLSDETISLSHIAPNSVSVVNGNCGTGVKFSGTNDGTIGTNQMRNRKMKGNILGNALSTKLQTACNDKETKKRECTDSTLSLTEETIFFPSNPDMAERFANALKQLVLLSGGRANVF
jgi:hypothetical protein